MPSSLNSNAPFIIQSPSDRKNFFGKLTKLLNVDLLECHGKPPGRWLKEKDERHVSSATSGFRVNETGGGVRQFRGSTVPVFGNRRRNRNGFLVTELGLDGMMPSDAKKVGKKAEEDPCFLVVENVSCLTPTLAHSLFP